MMGLVRTMGNPEDAGWVWDADRLQTAIGDEDWGTIGRLRILAVALGGLLAGLAGVLISGQAPVHFHSGFSWALVGLVIFTAASLACGLASSAGLLIGARVVQDSGPIDVRGRGAVSGRGSTVRRASVGSIANTTTLAESWLAATRSAVRS
mgnify:CR=1 FL=1